jgi:ubiquinone/menaquinone biosynthesis C-methylase UbiE
MKRPLFIARQSAHPSGVLGSIIASIMQRETAELNAQALELLALQPTDSVLEIGFGHGRTLERLCAAAARGKVVGVDVSASMSRSAARRNQRALAEGRLELHTGDSAALPFLGARFHKVLAVHTLYFWDSPITHLREIWRVLRPGGALVLAFVPRSSPHAAQFPPEVYTFHEAAEVRALLEAAGFEALHVRQSGEAQLALANRPGAPV